MKIDSTGTGKRKKKRNFKENDNLTILQKIFLEKKCFQNRDLQKILSK